MIHDAGTSRGRMERMRAVFPDAAAVIYGHSHIPMHEQSDGFQLFNPGSPTDRRRQPRHTMGLARVTDGRVSFELIALD
jgi:predicted phosphodiesterase